MPPNVSSTGVTITNPLVLYRALLATNRIKPDQAQYRLGWLRRPFKGLQCRLTECSSTPPKAL
jgi:hypothetical protein